MKQDKVKNLRKFFIIVSYRKVFDLKIGAKRPEYSSQFEFSELYF